MEKEKKEDLKKKAQKTAIAATTAASLFVHNTYDKPLDIIEEAYEDEDINDEHSQKKKSSFKIKSRQLLNTLPLPIRIIFLLPLWSLGWLLMLLLRPIWENLLSGVLSQTSYWIILAAIIFIIIVISALIYFPGLPLAKLFNKKTISLILILIIGLFITDKILSLSYPAYRDFKHLIKATGSIAIVIISLAYIHFKTRKLKFTVTNDKYTFSN